MRRIVLSVAIFLAILSGAAAQDAGTLRRVGFLAVGQHLDTIRPEVVAELRRQGFFEGQIPPALLLRADEVIE